MLKMSRGLVKTSVANESGESKRKENVRSNMKRRPGESELEEDKLRPKKNASEKKRNSEKRSLHRPSVRSEMSKTSKSLPRFKLNGKPVTNLLFNLKLSWQEQHPFVGNAVPRLVPQPSFAQNVAGNLS